MVLSKRSERPFSLHTFTALRLDVPGCKVPEIGWNSVEGTGAAGEFYFVHSYYAEVVPETNLVSEYAGVKFTAMVAKGSLWACQFHPEKSGRLGLDLLARWLGLK